MLQDIHGVDRIYDHYQVERPRMVEKLRTAIRMELGSIPQRALRRRVVERIVSRDRQQYRRDRELLARPTREPNGSSPIERIKGRTALLNPRGELTGGNYAAQS